MDAAAELGLKVLYFPDSVKASVRGWPDLVIMGPDGVLFAELKRQSEDLSPDQRRIGACLTRAGLAWTVWRPRDYADGTVKRQLRSCNSR